MSPMASEITRVSIIYSTVFFRRISKKTSKLCGTGLCEGNSPVTGDFHAQRTSDAENVSIWWRHHEKRASSQTYQSNHTYASIPSCTALLFYPYRHTAVQGKLRSGHNWLQCWPWMSNCLQTENCSSLWNCKSEMKAWYVFGLFRKLVSTHQVISTRWSISKCSHIIV